MGRDPVADDEFREFVATRAVALRRVAFLLVDDWSLAEDMVQIALAKTYLSWGRIADRNAVESYARRVLANTAASWWRRRWHGERPTASVPDSIGRHGDPADRHAERDAVWRHLRQLPARQRAILVLRFYEDLTEAQTALTLGISVGTVKSQSARALRTLRHVMGGDTAPSANGRAGDVR